MRLKMLLALALAFPLSSARSETLVQSGREIATTFCSRCHAIGPSGESPKSKVAAVPAPVEKISAFRFAGGARRRHRGRPRRFGNAALRLFNGTNPRLAELS